MTARPVEKPVQATISCEGCDGQGIVPHYTFDGSDFLGTKECPRCKGSCREPIVRLEADAEDRCFLPDRCQRCGEPFDALDARGVPLCADCMFDEAEPETTENKS